MTTKRWRTALLNAIALVLAVAFIWLGWLTGGLGLVGTAGALVVLMVALARWRSWSMGRIRLGALNVILLVTVWNLTSVAVYATPDNGESLTTKVATWARDHGLGDVVDRLEAMRYSTPPSKEPAEVLELNVTTVPTPATSSVPTPTSLMVTTTTEPPGPQPPEPLTPVFKPALPGEGQWIPVARAGGFDALWATSIRPIASVGGIVATVVVIDQTHLRSVMFNGGEEPGGSGWVRGNRVPVELRSALVATMNGGFRFEHIKGGYMTEGRVVKPMNDGDATIAIDANGKMMLGKMGRDLFDEWLGNGAE